MLRPVAAGLAAAAVVAGLGVTGSPAGRPSTPTPSSGLQSLVDAGHVDLPFDPRLAAVACPIERGPVKEGSDRTRSAVSTTVTRTTIAHLRLLPKPSSYPTSTRIAPNEDRTWQVSARLTKFKLEADGDVHLVLVDSAGRTLITEIPYGACVPTSSRWKTAIASARRTFTSAYHVTTSWHRVNRAVVVRGLGFFDVPHGQTGAAPNGIELHPVVGLKLA